MSKTSEILNFRELMTGRTGAISVPPPKRLVEPVQELTRPSSPLPDQQATSSPPAQDPPKRKTSYPRVKAKAPTPDPNEPIVDFPEDQEKSTYRGAPGMRDSSAPVLSSRSVDTIGDSQRKFQPYFVAGGIVAILVGISFSLNQNHPKESITSNLPASENSQVLATVTKPNPVPKELLATSAIPQKLIPLHQPIVANALSLVDAQLDVVSELTELQQFGDAVRLLVGLKESHPSTIAEINPTLDGVLSLWLGSQVVPKEHDFEALEVLAYAGNETARKILSLAMESHSENPGMLRTAAKSGDLTSMVGLAHELSRQNRLEEAAMWFEKAANEGNFEAAYCFGECRIFGKGIAPDPIAGVEFLQFAASGGEHRAMDLLGVCHVRGLGVEIDHEKAVTWFKRAIEEGSTTAHYNLGARFAQGQGVPKDVTQAATLFGQGAEKGNVVCMATYARCLEAGYGVTKSADDASQWYQRAAAQGNSVAINWCQANSIGFESVEVPN